MANFDAMIPLMPRDIRNPVDRDRELMRVNQVVREQRLDQVRDDERSTVQEDLEHNSKHQHPQQQQSDPQASPASAEEGIETEPDGAAEQDRGRHIDTYV
ncbi:hypothetical protein CWI84_10430 [Idiomarina tyrosinivorans]|uniref:Uncharacterized protein n=1 Tax=Idiomarina tyrosinivorans TaxID=1445662 RepID=A0A432ZLC6_9GAMM|nr:hypothetical protein [Idiomarina tyrosinivorans]RUO78749.1 hypothetical protein CWI84_10430 [Idiomarina tyrosinivorans]